MAEVFLSLWNRSIAAGWMILAVVLVRLVWRKAPKSGRCLLWLLVGVRLVFPFSVESVLSLIPSAEVVPKSALASNSFQIDSGLRAVNSTVNEYLRSQYFEGVAVPAHHTRDILTAGAVIWAAGLTALLLWALVSWLRLRSRVAEAVRSEDGVWLCGGIGSPFLLGIVRPRIYLPAGLGEEERACVVAHERSHLRRRDHWTKPAAFLILAVYWFSPLVWLAYVLLCRDIELACDERVIRELGPECKKAYSQALLRCSVQRSAIAACPLAFGEAGVKERVKNVLNYRKPAFWAVAASLAVIAVAAVCFLTDPPSAPPEAVDTPDTSPEYSNINAANRSEGPPEYTGGALLYQHPALSSYFSDSGGYYASVIENGDTLTITNSDGTTMRYALEEQKDYTVEEFYQEFDLLAEEEEWMHRKLLPEEVSGITRRTYVSEELTANGDYAKEAIWKISCPGGETRTWTGGKGRLFALIDLNEAFSHPMSIAPVAALWTYDPSMPTAIPVRFDLEGGASVWTSDGELSLDSQAGEWTDSLTVEKGRTVYWRPSREGAPTNGAALFYSYYEETLERRETDSISLRPAMNYEGLYGGRTYGICQDWLGALSSQFHGTRAGMDRETRELVICRTDFGDSSAGSAEPRTAVAGALIRDYVVWDVKDAEE